MYECQDDQMRGHYTECHFTADELYWHDGLWLCHHCIFQIYYDWRSETPSVHREILPKLVTLEQELARRAGLNPPAGSDTLG